MSTGVDGAVLKWGIRSIAPGSFMMS